MRPVGQAERRHHDVLVPVNFHSGISQGFRRNGRLRAGVLVQKHRGRDHPQRFRTALGSGQAGKALFDLVVDLPQLLRQLRHADGLEQVGHDLVLDPGLGVLKIVVAAQKRHLQQRLDGLRLSGEGRPGNKRHLDIRQQEIRLKLFHQLQRVQSVPGAAHKAEAQRFPVDQLADGAQQLRLIVRHQNGQNLTLFHVQPSIRIPDLIIKDFREKHKPGMLHFHIPGLSLDLVFGYFTSASMFSVVIFCHGMVRGSLLANISASHFS